MPVVLQPFWPPQRPVTACGSVDREIGSFYNQTFFKHHVQQRAGGKVFQ